MQSFGDRDNRRRIPKERCWFRLGFRTCAPCGYTRRCSTSKVRSALAIESCPLTSLDFALCASLALRLSPLALFGFLLRATLLSFPFRPLPLLSFALLPSTSLRLALLRFALLRFALCLALLSLALCLALLSLAMLCLALSLALLNLALLSFALSASLGLFSALRARRFLHPSLCFSLGGSTRLGKPVALRSTFGSNTSVSALLCLALAGLAFCGLARLQPFSDPKGLGGLTGARFLLLPLRITLLRLSLSDLSRALLLQPPLRFAFGC